MKVNLVDSHQADRHVAERGVIPCLPGQALSAAPRNAWGHSNLPQEGMAFGR